METKELIQQLEDLKYQYLKWIYTSKVSSVVIYHNHEKTDWDYYCHIDYHLSEIYISTFICVSDGELIIEYFHNHNKTILYSIDEFKSVIGLVDNDNQILLLAAKMLERARE